jgi:signal peptidase I
MREGTLFINGQAVPKVADGTFTTEGGAEIPQFRETLPNGVSYETLDADPQSIGDNTREFVVPPGHYFMMGDNRDNSLDSRFDVGYVPFENFVGKAQVIFFSMENDASPLEIWQWPSSLRPSRIFNWLG